MSVKLWLDGVIGLMDWVLVPYMVGWCGPVSLCMDLDPRFRLTKFGDGQRQEEIFRIEYILSNGGEFQQKKAGQGSEWCEWATSRSREQRFLLRCGGRVSSFKREGEKMGLVGCRGSKHAVLGILGPSQKEKSGSRR